MRFHPDLLAAKEAVYDPNGLVIHKLEKARESEEYGACAFELNERRIQFRVGKITPTKIGQFVTVWKRIGNGPIQPYDLEDPVDFFVISVRTKDHFGQFVFPTVVLVEKDILSKDGCGGKRGIRVYPPWDIADNTQAKKTQAWQLLYFCDISTAEQTGRIKDLFF